MRLHRSRRYPSPHYAQAGIRPRKSHNKQHYIIYHTYDANGNILTLKRNGPSTAILSTGNLDMDDLTYHYYNYAGGYSKNTNRLACLQEAGTGYAGNYSDDIDAPASACSTFTGQSGRYAYDETGSLIKDEGECIDTIKWTVDRKVKKIIRSSSLLTAQGKTLPDIEYIYNAMRQRVAKIVKPREATTKLLKDSTHWVSTHYVYDASGNVMAVYEKTMENIGGGEEPHWKDNLALKENHLYGSSRLAIAKPAAPTNWYYTFACGIPENCIGDSVYRPFSIATATFATGRHLGYKEFELNNHLGNVIAVVSDRKVMSSLCPEWEKDFAEENYDNITAQNANLSFTGGKLRVEPYAEDGGVIFDFNTSPGAEYVISFDLDLGTTISSDTLMVVAYDDDPLTGISNLTYLTPRINANGTYEFEYSTTMSNGKLKFYYASDDNMGPGGGNRFDVDNLGIFKKAPSEWDYTCPSPWHFYYMPDVLYHSDYYPGGQQQVGRTYPGNGIAANDYRYGHNSQHHENEVYKGAYSAEHWMYDARVIRRWEIDPIVDESVSPYEVFANNFISINDPDGLCPRGGRKGRYTRHRSHDKVSKHTMPSNRGDGVSKRHMPTIGEVFMKALGALRPHSQHNLSLIPQGYWSNSKLTPYNGPGGSGVLKSGQHSDPIAIATPQGQYKRKVSKIEIDIQNEDPSDNGPPMGYLRVTGIYRHGSDRAKYRMMFTNTGGTGFGIGAGEKPGTNEWMGGGHSGFLTSLPQWFSDVMKEFPNMFGDDNNSILGGALLADDLNNKVFSPFRNVSGIRVENMFSVKPVFYQLSLQYRQWNWVAPRDRRDRFKMLHDVTGNKGAGFR